MFAIQAVITITVLAWCLFQISVKDRTDRNDVTAYWSMTSSLIAYWFPSPVQTTKDKKKDD